MTAAVVPFDSAQRDIVATLRSMLEAAERGELTCLIAAGAMSDGASGGTFCGGSGVLAALGELRVVEARALEYLRSINGGRL